MEEEVVKKSSSKKVWLPIVIVGVAAVVVLVLIILGTRMLASNGTKPAPVMLRDESEYVMYESRTGEVLMTYRVTLQNNTGSAIENFALRALLEEDYKSGFVLSSDATVRKSGEQMSFFTLQDGEKQTFEIVLTTSFYPRSGISPSKALPQLYAVYPDGTEGVIQIH